VVTLAFHTLHFSGLFGGSSRALEQIVAGTADAGFSALGLDLAVVDDYLARGGTVDRVARPGSDRGLRHTDVLPFFATPGQDARAAVARPAELAAAVGAPLVICSAPEPMERADMFAVFAAATEVSASLGLRLAIEYIPHTSLRTLADAVQLCAELGWDRAGLVVDSYHSFLGGASAEEIAALDASQIAVVQYADARTSEPADRSDESRNHRQQPGAGVLPLAEFVAAVRATGYDGVVAAEVLSADLRASNDLAGSIRECYAALAVDWAD
jgi:sugar phosphate isomerase/epimerase